MPTDVQLFAHKSSHIYATINKSVNLILDLAQPKHIAVHQLLAPELVLHEIVHSYLLARAVRFRGSYSNAI